MSKKIVITPNTFVNEPCAIMIRGFDSSKFTIIGCNQNHVLMYYDHKEKIADRKIIIHTSTALGWDVYDLNLRGDQVKEFFTAQCKDLESYRIGFATFSAMHTLNHILTNTNYLYLLDFKKNKKYQCKNEQFPQEIIKSFDDDLLLAKYFEEETQNQDLVNGWIRLNSDDLIPKEIKNVICKYFVELFTVKEYDNDNGQLLEVTGEIYFLENFESEFIN